jgi:predicted ATP-grasp superfamily ATP-dependent carboligase
MIHGRPPGALVLGGDFLIELGVARSLGRRGVPVWVVGGAAAASVGGRRLAAIRTSRHCRRTLEWPAAGEPERVAYLLDAARRHGLSGWVLIPSGDNEAALVARNHDLLSATYRLTTPAWDTLRWTYDKRRTYELAERVGVPVPETWRPQRMEDLDDIDEALPVVLKPAMKDLVNRFTAARAWPARTPEQLRRLYADAVSLVPAETVLVQRLVPGGGAAQVSFACLADRGRIVAELTARRSRQYPADFGQGSTLVESVDIPELREPCARLIAELGYDGLMELEFKRDEEDGSYRLLDMNARPWVWHPLGAAAGVDFPHLLYRVATGEDVGAGLRGKPGRRWVHLAIDAPAAVLAMRTGRLRARDYLRSLRRPLQLAALAADDPLPALADVGLLAAGAMRRGADGPVAAAVTDNGRSRAPAR